MNHLSAQRNFGNNLKNFGNARHEVGVVLKTASLTARRLTDDGQAVSEVFMKTPDGNHV